MPVLFLLEIYYYDTPDHCTGQETRAVVARILCIRGSGRMCRDMLLRDCHRKESVLFVLSICSLAGSMVEASTYQSRIQSSLRK